MTQDHEQATATDNWTVGRMVRWAMDDFQKRGFESPRLEAELLLGEVLQLDRVHLLLEAMRPLSQEELAAFRAMIQRRRTGEPIAYILKRREFYGHTFKVDARGLVPRPDTEILVEEILDRTAHRDLSGRALDLCTGTGCVAISFALVRRTWQVTATDLSAEALELARENALSLGAVWGLRFAAGDLFAAVPEDERFELISANPPYIPRREIETLDPDVRDHEPHCALDGGEDGLSFYRRLATEAPGHLVPGGILAVEVGAEQAADVEQLLAHAGFEDLRRKKDYSGHERVVSGRRARV